VVVGPEYLGNVFRLGEGSHLLGRSPDADVRLPLETISRKHALFVVAGNTVTIEDLGSRSGTFINGKRIESRADLAPGARIVVGGLTLKLVAGY
jgi:adenylate cyclase